MKYFLSLILLCNFTFCLSQDCYKIDYTYTDIEKFEVSSSLFTNNKEAIFNFFDKRTTGISDLENGKVTFIANDELSKFYYTNDKLVYCRHLFNNYEIMYSDEYKEKVKWVINTKRTKNIGKYICYEATTTVNGRSYVVWFTFAIPVKLGPMKFHNLPGLVMEVTESNNYFKITFQKISKIKNLDSVKIYKDYFLGEKKPHNYEAYERNIIKTVVNNQIRFYAEIKKENLEKSGSKTYVDNNMSETNDINMFIDIPKQLLAELRKNRF